MKNPGAEPAIACTAILMLACLPLLALAQETLRSLSADTPVEVEFINESGGLVEVHWVDYEGNEAAGTPVRSNGTLRINSYATHPFVVRDPETKKRITFFVVGRESKQTFYITPHSSRGGSLIRPTGPEPPHAHSGGTGTGAARPGAGAEPGRQRPAAGRPSAGGGPGRPGVAGTGLRERLGRGLAGSSSAARGDHRAGPGDCLPMGGGGLRRLALQFF